MTKALLEADKGFINDNKNLHIGNRHLKETFNKDFEDYFKFCFIRNPWERMVSGFFFFLTNVYLDQLNDMKLKDNLEDIRKRMKEVDITKQKDIFFEWLSESNMYITKNSQISWAYNSNGKNDFNFVGNISNIDFDWRRLCGIIDIKYEKLKVLNSTSHYHYSEYYNEKSYDWVDRYFKEDIDYFDYKFLNNKIKKYNICIEQNKRIN